MRISFPAFIKRIFETHVVDKSMFDVRNTSASATPTRQSVLVPPVREIKPSFPRSRPLDQQSAAGKHLSTPMPQTPVFVRNNPRHVSNLRDPPSVVLSQGITLTTPMVMSTLNKLESGATPADAFPDILEIIDQGWPAYPFETSPTLNAGSQVTDSVLESERPKNELELIEMLITVAEQIESEKDVSRSYLYTRPEDVLLSRKNGQRKCQHAKRMTDDEKKYYKNSSSCRAKERRIQKCHPALGVRRSTRINKPVRYF